MSDVVLLARRLDQGGAERQLVTLACAMKARGIPVHVVLFYSGGVFDHELMAAGVPLYFADKQGRWDFFGFLWRLGAVLRRLRPAVVYSFLDLPNILATLLCRFAGRPRLVWGVRAAGMEMQHYDCLSQWLPRLENVLSRHADCIVANSEAGRAWAVSRSFPAERMVVVENGIDTRRFAPDPRGRERVRAAWGVAPDVPLLGLVARLDAMKDHSGFLETCARLARQRPDLMFVCVGAGSVRVLETLQAQADVLGIAGRVIWAGARQDMPAVYAALDVACSSSAFGEGFSNAVAEGMACGVPAAVTDVGDSARIVGETGAVAPPRNPQALAEAVLALLQRIDGEPGLGLAARDRIVERFSEQRMLERTLAVLTGSA